MMDLDGPISSLLDMNQHYERDAKRDQFCMLSRGHWSWVVCKLKYINNFKKLSMLLCSNSF